MKFKKLVLMGLLCCTVTASRGITALAAGAEVETDGVQEDVEAEKAEKAADGTKVIDKKGEGENKGEAEESADDEAAVLALAADEFLEDDLVGRTIDGDSVLFHNTLSFKLILKAFSWIRYGCP